MQGIEDVDDDSFQRMSQFSMSTPGLKDKNRCVQEPNKKALYAACRLGHMLNYLAYALSGKRRIMSFAFFLLLFSAFFFFFFHVVTCSFL